MLADQSGFCKEQDKPAKALKVKVKMKKEEEKNRGK